MDDISGVHPAAEGQQQKSGTSGRQVLALQEGTNREMRPRTRRFEKTFQKCMEKAVYLIHKYYKAGRKYSYVDQTDGMSQSSKIPLDFDELDLVFNVIIQPGSSLPKDKESVANKALTMAQMFPEQLGVEFVAKALEMEGDMPVNMTSQVSSMKQNAMEKVRKLGNNPQAVMDAIKNGDLDKDVLSMAMKDLKTERGKAQSNAQGPAQATPDNKP